MESVRLMGAVADARNVSIEPGDRLVVLARPLDTISDEAARSLEQAASEWRPFGSTGLGSALYRHQSIFKGQSDAPVWSHAEFAYFRDVVPSDVVERLVRSPQRSGEKLLRAEILVTTPAPFVFPHDWAGSSRRLDRKPSIEYLDVHPSHLRDYRDIMQRYVGPAAAKLVAMGKLGTFRSMETAAVLFQDGSFRATWNQIHLSEVISEGFRGFGEEFDAALREELPDGGFASVFAGLDGMRTITRWTLSDPVREDDAAIGEWAKGLIR
jgi:hypothetical protein